jgi:Na+-translocating ferredoxin:NAD+ oxidoreductase RnfC subunit
MAKDIQKYVTYLSPEFIYVPFDKMELLRIKKSKQVLNDFYLGELSNGKKLYSPVSGKIIGTKEMTFLGTKSNTLVIENNFMERREKLHPLRNITKLKKAEILESLEKYNLGNKINSKTTLVVNSLYDKKYDLKDMIINYESYEEILEAIDEFLNIFNMKNAYICIDKSDIYSINAYEKYINAFLNICMVHSNKKFRNNKNVVFYNIEDILAIHKAMCLDYMYDNVIVTINDGNTTVVKVKLYTSLFELLKALKISITNKIVYVDNKEIINVKDFVIDRDVRSIIVRNIK